MLHNTTHLRANFIISQTQLTFKSINFLAIITNFVQNNDS